MDFFVFKYTVYVYDKRKEKVFNLQLQHGDVKTASVTVQHSGRAFAAIPSTRHSPRMYAQNTVANVSGFFLLK